MLTIDTDLPVTLIWRLCGLWQSLLFNTSKPFSRSQNCVSQDVDLMVDCFVSCFRITPHNNDLLKVCLNAVSPTMFHFVLVSVLHRIITQVDCVANAISCPMALLPLPLAVWLSGNALASINVVTLRQTRLVLGWVTVCSRVNHRGM